MLPTPVLSVSGKGFARLRISAWHFSPAPPILYAVRAIVYHKSRVLSRVLRDFSGAKPPEPPGLNPRGTGSPCQSGTRRGVCLRNLQLGAKPTEPPFYWQCRQPRRGGTGGEELRRLRWSSPPGQVEQVPRGFSSPLPPPPADTTAAGSVSAAGGLMPGMQGAKPLA